MSLKRLIYVGQIHPSHIVAALLLSSFPAEIKQKSRLLSRDDFKSRYHTGCRRKCFSGLSFPITQVYASLPTAVSEGLLPDALLRKCCRRTSTLFRLADGHSRILFCSKNLCGLYYLDRMRSSFLYFAPVSMPLPFRKKRMS